MDWGASLVADLPCGREQCQAQPWMPWERVSLSAAVPTLVSFLPGSAAPEYKAASGTSLKLIFANI